MADDLRHDPSELEQRVAYAMLLPAVRLGRALGVKLGALEDWIQMAYYQELRAAGLKMHEVSEALAVSMRTVALLSRRLKRNFLAPDVEVGLPRRIEFLLWGEPLSEARIAQAIPDHAPEEIAAALAELVAHKRIALRKRSRSEVYERVHQESRLMSPDWRARIDALNNLLGNVTHAVYARFFRDDERAFARTLSFRIRRADLPRLRALYEEVIYPSLRELERDAGEAPDAFSMDLSLCWAPYDYMRDADPPSVPGAPS